MTEFFIYYTEANIICTVIFVILLGHDLFSVDRQEKQLKYDNALVAFMLYFLSDILTAAVISGYLPKTAFSVAFSRILNYFLMAALTHAWLNYMMAVEQLPHRNRPINRLAVVSPFLVSTIALAVIYLFRPELLFSDALEPTPLFSVFLIAVPIIYILAVVFYTVRLTIHEENAVEKRRHLYIGLFPLLVVIGGLAQLVLLPNTPIFCFACTILMLIFYIQSMDRQISADPLTKLNNRGQLLRYVSQKANFHMEGRRTFVVMMDVNDFKKINDTYGHAEGDRALMLLADALRSVVRSRSMPVFLGRYGGDEFILIAHPADETEIETLVGEIRAQIQAKCAEAETPYLLSVGIGYDELLQGSDSFQKCQQRADHKLYLDKEYVKLNAGNKV